MMINNCSKNLTVQFLVKSYIVTHVIFIYFIVLQACYIGLVFTKTIAEGHVETTYMLIAELIQVYVNELTTKVPQEKTILYKPPRLSSPLDRQLVFRCHGKKAMEAEAFRMAIEDAYVNECKLRLEVFDQKYGKCRIMMKYHADRSPQGTAIYSKEEWDKALEEDVQTRQGVGPCAFTVQDLIDWQTLHQCEKTAYYIKLKRKWCKPLVC